MPVTIRGSAGPRLFTNRPFHRAISRVLAGVILAAAPSVALARASLLDCPVDRLDYVDRKSKRIFSVGAYADAWEYVYDDPVTDERVIAKRPPPKDKDGK